MSAQAHIAAAQNWKHAVKVARNGRSLAVSSGRLKHHASRIISRWETPLEEALALVEQKHKTFFSPHSLVCRYIVLFVACVIVVGPYCAYDSVGALQVPLQKDLDISGVQFSYLYSIYSIPNIILVFIGGLLIDRIGVRNSAVLFSFVVSIGTGLVVIAAQYYKSFWLMIVGRFVFGMGSESLFVAQNAIIAAWFNGHESGLAMGLGTAAGRLGTFFAFSGMNYLSTKFGTYTSGLWFAFTLCALSFFICIVYWWFDMMGNRNGGLKMSIGDDLLEDEASILGTVREMPLAFWLVSIIASMYYGTVFPFQGFSTSLLQNKYHMSAVEAGSTTSLIPLTSLILMPILGFVADKVGRRAILVAVGTAGLLPVFIGLAFTSYSPIWAYFMVGVVFSLVPACLWPAFPLIVPADRLGAAFGLASALVNTVEMLSFNVAGILVDYFQTESIIPVFYLGTTVCALTVAIIWNIVDARTGGKANSH